MRTIIIGAVAAGASTAARLRRLDENMEILLFEKGNYFSYANCGLPYYIGNVIEDRDKLFIQNQSKFKARFNIDVKLNFEVNSIDPVNKKITAYNSLKGEFSEFHYDKLVISTGSSPFIPPISGITGNRVFVVRDVQGTDSLKQFIEEKKPKHITVAGAGFIGIEMAENINKLGIQVAIIEKNQAILPQFDYPIVIDAQRVLTQNGFELYTGKGLSQVENTENGLSLGLDNGEIITTDALILSIGVRPNSSLAMAAGLELGKNGGVLVNEFLQTSDPNIYAAGDVIEFRNPVTKEVQPTYLAGPANKQARIIADNIVEPNSSKYDGSISTAIVKVFDYTLATTGASVKTLIRNGINFEKLYVFGGSNASYYPGSTELMVQLTFDPTSKKILGAQITGKKGVDKRIDVVSTLIQQNGTIEDLAYFEHTYAPPFSSAKDPLNMAGFIADNWISGKSDLFNWDEQDNFTQYKLIDVRTTEEFKNGTIPNALNIPLESIRDRISELDPATPLRLFCKTGLRSYLALRILKQNGFQVKSLSGGYDLWFKCQP